MSDRIRVLAIDADVAVLRQRARILEDRHGFDVDTTQSIQAARERLDADAQSVDCILYHAAPERVDDALEFIRWVADRFPSIPTVFSTDVSIDSMPDEAFECGATAFVPSGKTTAPHNRLASRIRSLVTAQLKSDSPKDGGFVWLGGDQTDAEKRNTGRADAMQDGETDDNHQIPPETIASIRNALTADSDSKRSKSLVAFLLLEVLYRVRDDHPNESHAATETPSLSELESGYKRVADRIATEGRHADNADSVVGAFEPNWVLQVIDEEFPSVTGDVLSTLLGQLLAVEQVDTDDAREIASPTADARADDDEETDPLLALVRTSLGEMSPDVLPEELSTESEVAEEIAPADTPPSIDESPTPEIVQSDGGLLGLVEAAFTDDPTIDQDDTPPTASADTANDSIVSESQFDVFPSDEKHIEADDSTPDDEDTSNSVASLVSAALSETDTDTGVAESSTVGAETGTDAIGEPTQDERDPRSIGEPALDEHDTETIDGRVHDEDDTETTGESLDEEDVTAIGESLDEEDVTAIGESLDEHEIDPIGESPLDEDDAGEIKAPAQDEDATKAIDDTKAIEDSVTEELEELTEIESHPVVEDITEQISDDRLKNLSRDELLTLVKDLADRETQTDETDQTGSERTPEDETTVATATGETPVDTAVAADSLDSTSDASTTEDVGQPTEDSTTEDVDRPIEDVSQPTEDLDKPSEELSQPTDTSGQSNNATQAADTTDESPSMSEIAESAAPDTPDEVSQSTDPFEQFGSGQTEYERPTDLELTTGDVVLVQCGSQDDRKQKACIDLLGVDDVADRNVLLVRYTEMNGPRLERIATHANRVTLVSVGYNQRVPQSVQKDVRTVNVTNPNDVTRLGIVMTATLDNWSARDGETVVCFDPLNVLLRYKNVENVFRFLHILLGKLRSGNAISHFHVDPTAGDPQEINTLKPLFDAVLAIDSVGVSVEH